MSWEGQLCPSPPASPEGPASCGLPGTGRLVTQHRGCCTRTRWPPLPTPSTRPLGGSRHCPDFVGWTGFWWGSPCAGNHGTAWGGWREGACARPGTERAGPLSAVSTPASREGPGPRVGAVHASPTWGQVAPGPQGLWGSGLVARLLPIAHLPPPASRLPALSNTVETATFFSVLCLNRSGGGEEGQGPGAAAGGEGSLPSPITGTDLIYLFWLKKKRTKTTLHCIWLDP